MPSSVGEWPRHSQTRWWCALISMQGQDPARLGSQGQGCKDDTSAAGLYLMPFGTSCSPLQVLCAQVLDLVWTHDSCDIIHTVCPSSIGWHLHSSHIRRHRHGSRNVTAMLVQPMLSSSAWNKYDNLAAGQTLSPTSTNIIVGPVLLFVTPGKP